MKFKINARSIFSLLIMAVFALGLQACGGGSSAPEAPLPDQNGEGIYTGTATVDQGNTEITDLKGMIYGTRIMVFSALTHVLYDGTLTSVSSDDFTATLDVYENGVKTQSAVPVSGKVLTANSITGTMGTVGSVGNHNGTFSLTYDSAYTRDATTTRIEATGLNEATGTTYGTLDLLGGHTFQTDLAFSVLSTGASSCSIIDAYSIPDSTVNIYSFNNMTIRAEASCLDSYEGTGYSGMASVIDDGVGGTDNRILIAYSNGTNSVFGVLTKP